MFIRIVTGYFIFDDIKLRVRLETEVNQMNINEMDSNDEEELLLQDNSSMVLSKRKEQQRQTSSRGIEADVKENESNSDDDFWGED